MTGEALGQIITSVATLITAAGSVWVSLRNSRKIDDTAAKVDAVHIATDGITSKLIASTATVAHRDGVDAGISQEKDRAAVAAAAEPLPVTIKNIAPIPVVNVPKEPP